MIVGFSRPKKFKVFSHLIRWFQGGTKYSHCYLRFNMVVGNTLRELVAEASYGKVHLINSLDFEKKNVIVQEFKFSIDGICRNNAMNYIVDKLQRPYSVANIFGIIFKKWFGITVFNDGDSRFICSELVLRALADRIKITNPDAVTPVEIYKAIQNDQSFQKLH